MSQDNSQDNDQGSGVPADSNEPVITNTHEAAMAVGDWFVNASPAEVQAFVQAHGDNARQRKERGELPDPHIPRTWKKG